MVISSSIIGASTGRGPVRVLRSAIVAVSNDVNDTVNAVQSLARWNQEGPVELTGAGA